MRPIINMANHDNKRRMKQKLSVERRFSMGNTTASCGSVRWLSYISRRKTNEKTDTSVRRRGQSLRQKENNLQCGLRGGRCLGGDRTVSSPYLCDVESIR